MDFANFLAMPNFRMMTHFFYVGMGEFELRWFDDEIDPLEDMKRIFNRNVVPWA